VAGDVVDVPVASDPLLMLSHLIASRTFLAGSALALNRPAPDPSLGAGLVR